MCLSNCCQSVHFSQQTYYQVDNFRIHTDTYTQYIQSEHIYVKTSDAVAVVVFAIVDAREPL